MAPLTAVCFTCGRPYLVSEGHACRAAARSAATPARRNPVTGRAVAATSVRPRRVTFARAAQTGILERTPIGMTTHRVSQPPSRVTRLATGALSARVGAAGLCSDSNSDKWFPAEPHRNNARARRDYEAYARAACGGCAVLMECRELALRIESQPGHGSHGVWGALAPWERETLIAARTVVLS